MAWLAVNKDGGEIISEGLPERHNRYGIWQFNIYVDNEIIDTKIYLPKDSIKKLIGRELTWDDEAFDIGE